MSKILQNIFEVISENMDEFDASIGGCTQRKTEYSMNVVDDLKARQTSKQYRSKDSSDLVEILRQKYRKRGILISYDISAQFALKQLVLKTVEDLKELGFEDDIWFDKDESKVNCVTSFAQRLESSEQCNAAIIFLSRGYCENSPGKYELDIFQRRILRKEVTPNGNFFRVFIVKCEDIFEVRQLASFNIDVDLTNARFVRCNIAEKSSVIVGALCGVLESCVTFATKLYQEVPARDSLDDKGYTGKIVDMWDKWDVQEWLCTLGVHERYKASFEEREIDGFLLQSLTEEDMSDRLFIDSKIIRRKILTQLHLIVDKEREWDGGVYKMRKAREDSVYIVCDPKDYWIADLVKTDLMKIGMFVHMNDGVQCSDAKQKRRSKSTIRYLCEASTIIVVLTPFIEVSNIMFREIILSAWLEKCIISLMFKNIWQTMRVSLKSILASKPAIDFTKQHCSDGLEILRYHIQPKQCQPRAIFQRYYLDKMLNGVKDLEAVASMLNEVTEAKRWKVYLSFNWDMSCKITKIKEYLQAHGCEVWCDQHRTAVVSCATQPWKRTNERILRDSIGFIQEQISYCDIVVICFSQKYLYSDIFVKDLKLVQLHRKPVIPVMLQWCAKPFERVQGLVTKNFRMLCGIIDMTNEKKFRRQMKELVHVVNIYNVK